MRLEQLCKALENMHKTVGNRNAWGKVEVEKPHNAKA